MLACTLTLALTSLAPAPVALQQPDGRLAVHAARILLGDGRTIEDGWLTVEAGKIVQIGRGVRVPPDWPVVEHDGVLTAGIVSFASAFGADGEDYDEDSSMQPELRIAAGFLPGDSDFRWALDQGITTLVLLASSRNLAGGVTAVVKTDGSLLAREGHLCLSLSDSVSNFRRKPTSYSGAIAMLEQALAEPRGVMAEAAAGRLPVLVHADARHEVARAAEFARAHELRGAIVGAPRAGELGAALVASNLGIVLAPIGIGADRHLAETPAKLVEAGVPFAFGASSKDPLRLSVAFAVRSGLDSPAAWKALTLDAARLAAVDDRVGRLEGGLDADFVLWSGDPVELTSAVRAVFVGGKLVSGEL
jgi:imidazolonepropionase-like amidohydrolase